MRWLPLRQWCWTHYPLRRASKFGFPELWRGGVASKTMGSGDLVVVICFSQEARTNHVNSGAFNTKTGNVLANNWLKKGILFMQDFGLTTSRQSSGFVFSSFDCRLSINWSMSNGPTLYGHWPKVGSNERSLSTGQLEVRSPQASPNHFDTSGTHGSALVFLQHLTW